MGRSSLSVGEGVSVGVGGADMVVGGGNLYHLKENKTRSKSLGKQTEKQKHNITFELLQFLVTYKYNHVHCWSMNLY